MLRDASGQALVYVYFEEEPGNTLSEVIKERP
jgi:hypothetical protein